MKISGYGSWILIAATSLILPSPGPTLAELEFKENQSQVIYEHDVLNDDSDTTFDRQKIKTGSSGIPQGYPGYQLPNKLVTDPLGVTSRAKAGIGHLESPFAGSLVLQPGTFVDQTDTNNVSDDFSELRLNFTLLWKVEGSPFGPSLIDNFTIPVKAVVGSGMDPEAQLEANIEWFRNPVSGSRYSLRSPFNHVEIFNVPRTTTTTSITMLPEGFKDSADGDPGSLVQFDVGDKFIIEGSMIFRAKNAESPTRIGYNARQLYKPINPTLYYKFDDDKGEDGLLLGDDFANESAPIGFSVQGSYRGNVIADDLVAGGIQGSAARFVNNLSLETGSNSMASISQVDAIVLNGGTFASDYSIELWFNATTPADIDQPLIGVTPLNSANNAALLQLDAEGTISFVHDSTPDGVAEAVLTSAMTYNTEQWHHLVAINDAGVLKLYLDGKLDLNMALGAGGVFSADEIFDVAMAANNQLAPTAFFNGALDEVAFYDMALDSGMVLRNFRQANQYNGGLVAGASIPEPTTAVVFMIGLLASLTRRQQVAQAPRE